MQPNPIGAAPASPPAAASGSVWGAVSLRRALSRLRGLAAVAFSISILVLLLDALNWTGVLNWEAPTNIESVTNWWTFGVSIGILVAIGIAIVALFITGVVYAITGATAWRRGVLAMNSSAFEYGPEQVKAARQAREDHSLTLWMIVVYVAAGMAASIVGGSLSAVLDNAGRGPLPGLATTLASNLAGSIALIAAYHYGSRHLVGLLFGLSSPEGQRRLVRGRDLLLTGAVVGLGGAFVPVSWAFEGAVVASLAIILLGANDLLEAYNNWLSGVRVTPVTMRGPQAIPA